MIHSLSAYRRALATALALLTLSVPLASSAAQTSPAFDKALEKDEALMEEGDFKAAISPLTKAEKLSGEPSAQVLLDLAICFNRVEKFKDAESYARAALEVAEDSVDQAGAFNQLGLSLLSGFLPQPRTRVLRLHEWTPGLRAWEERQTLALDWDKLISVRGGLGAF